jgi:hypothetical protein
LVHEGGNLARKDKDCKRNISPPNHREQDLFFTNH